jgi:hypothetical protein
MEMGVDEARNDPKVGRAEHRGAGGREPRDLARATESDDPAAGDADRLAGARERTAGEDAVDAGDGSPLEH